MGQEDFDFLVGFQTVRKYRCEKCHKIIEKDWVDFANHEDSCKGV